MLSTSVHNFLKCQGLDELKIGVLNGVVEEYVGIFYHRNVRSFEEHGMLRDNQAVSGVKGKMTPRDLSIDDMQQRNAWQ